MSSGSVDLGADATGGGGGGSGITELTGDVTAGPGSGAVAASVAAVGGQTASNVAAGAVLANAATSANTANAIVRRNGLGAVTLSDIVNSNIVGLADNNGQISTDFGAIFYSNSGFNCQDEAIYDLASSTPAIHWGDRTLLNSSAIQMVSWENATMSDPTGNDSVLWSDRNLCSDDSSIAMDWTDGNISLQTVGKGLEIKEGSNARMGVATLVGGSAVVSNNTITANTRIFLTSQNVSGTPGYIYVSARTASTSFTITSASALDTSTVAYLLMEPA